MYIQTLPQQTVDVFHKIKNVSFLTNFYLTGGTALSLQLGHRESEDLDFFIQDDFNPVLIQQELEKLGHLDSVEIAEGTLNTYLSGVKLQFLRYPYRMLEPFIKWNNVNISSSIDIACTKLITVSSRGSKKDFIDMYFLLDMYSLSHLFEMLDKKYEGTKYNHVHICKSLVYFLDADNQPMPRMHKKIEWEKIKEAIQVHVKKYTF